MRIMLITQSNVIKFRLVNRHTPESCEAYDAI